MFDGSGTSASVHKDPANSESEYTPKSDTSSGVSSGGSSSVVTLGSNNGVFSGAIISDPSEKFSENNFLRHEFEKKSQAVKNFGVCTVNELLSIGKFKKKVLQKNCSANKICGEAMLDSVTQASSDSTVNISMLGLQKNINSVSVKRSDSVGSNGPALKIKPVFVRLNRLSERDQALMQKSLTEFAQQQPSLASKLGITTQNQRKMKSSVAESDYEEDENTVSRIFKLRKRHKTREAKQKQGMSSNRFSLVLKRSFRYQLKKCCRAI